MSYWSELKVQILCLGKITAINVDWYSQTVFDKVGGKTSQSVLHLAWPNSFKETEQTLFNVWQNDIAFGYGALILEVLFFNFSKNQLQRLIKYKKPQ